VTGWFTLAPPRIIAHRGLALEAPENTLLSFLNALELGVTHLETDVLATSDGVAAISHDPDLGRLSGNSTPIRQLSLADVQRIDLGHDQHVPTLREALHAFPDAYFNIDIKADEALQPTIDAVRRERAVDRVLVTSFDETRRRRAVAALPGVATSPSSRGVVLAALASRAPLAFLRRRSLLGLQALQVPESYRGVPIVTGHLVRSAHENGVEVHVWTINEPSEMRRLFALGVDGIITDRADVGLEVMRAAGEAASKSPERPL
jgi:glycerophosphoryl diester phosphodiesterase